MLDHFQKEATRTFKDHGSLTPYQARMLNWGLGLGGEAGEVEELIKHHVFAEEALDLMELSKELGDVLWYITAIAETAGIRMTDIAELNMAKLNHRYSTGAYSNEEAQNRREREVHFTNSPQYRILQARIQKTTAPMNVIFVGPDGSGKTTLAKRVAENLGFIYHKCDYRQENKPELAKKLLEEQINVVYDRFYWPDDVLYCKVKNIEMPESHWVQYSEVIDLLQQRNTLYIYVGCDKSELIKRSKVWADDYVQIKHLDAIVTGYQNWLKYIDSLHLSVCTVDTTGIAVDSESFKALVNACCTAIETGQKVYSRIEEGENKNE